MKKNQMKTVVTVMGGIAKKIAESAVHAAVFAFVSKKVTNLMTKQEEKESKVRIEESSPKMSDGVKDCATNESAE